MTHVIDGREYAAALKQRVRRELERLQGNGAGVASILVGSDYAAEVYQRRIDAAAREVGMASRCERLDADATLGQLVGKIAELDVDPEISGIVVLRPLPPHLEEPRVFRALPPLKDLEAQHPENAGLLALGMPRFVPSTAGAAYHLLDSYMLRAGRNLDVAYDGLDIVLVGRSNNVGKPAAILGLARNATVVSAHKHTYDAGRLAEHTTRADVLIVAAGVPGLIRGEMVREGAIVIDIGINAVAGEDGRTRLVGDVDFDSVAPRVEAITPVPGGVGPVTDVWILHNAIIAAHAIAGHRDRQAWLTAGAE
jgi:methylenetetrahydrofolate dehydrogenase (NADP+)/methenyltetrahydrofolate cyclohydrolase